jgi:hypothetical protein
MPFPHCASLELLAEESLLEFAEEFPLELPFELPEEFPALFPDELLFCVPPMQQQPG